jgi:preprotein translocase subunit YajC
VQGNLLIKEHIHREDKGGSRMDFLAYATCAVPTGEGQGGSFTSFVPLLLMFAIFYFLLIRPQQKKSKQHKEMLSNLKKGDRVVSSGGLHGIITGMTDDVITMEIAPKVRVKVSRAQISRLATKEEK